MTDDQNSVGKLAFASPAYALICLGLSLLGYWRSQMLMAAAGFGLLFVIAVVAIWRMQRRSIEQEASKAIAKAKQSSAFRNGG